MADEPSDYAQGHLAEFVARYNAAQISRGAMFGWDDLPEHWRDSLAEAFMASVDKIQEELY